MVAFAPREEEILALEIEAGDTHKPEPERSQFSLLVRHFVERFFNHESASVDGDGKTRMIQVAFAACMPGAVFALYLWHPYHPMIGPLPPYWTQAGDHFFYVIYSFVIMGVVTVFEWDLFFPDLLDVFVLSTLPVPNRTLFRARIAAICILILGALLDANFLAPLALPAAMDPPNIWRFMGADLSAAALSGLFAATAVLAVQAVLITVLGERFFRRVSLFLQGVAIAVLVMLLLLFPDVARSIQAFMSNDNGAAFYFPPFWFLGLYQRILEGPTALPIYTRLAETGCLATVAAALTVALFYPLAYRRRVRQVVEGAGTRDTRSLVAAPLRALIQATVVRLPAHRGIYHFIGQTLGRVPRYRIYLVMYGGLGLSIVAACLLRLEQHGQSIRVGVSADGLRVATPLIAFWTVAGLRLAFTSPGNQQGGWIFRIIHGKPALEQLLPAKMWVLLCSLAVTLGSFFALRSLSSPELLTLNSTATQLILAIGFCLLLTDAFFLQVKIIPFTGTQPPASSQHSLAAALLKSFCWFPVVMLPPLLAEPWIEARGMRIAACALLIVIVHWRLRTAHRKMIEEHIALTGIYDDAEEFPLRLGLREY
jgi:hypothetical protein